MQQESANEFLHIQRHRFQLVAVFIIPPAEGYAPIIQADQAVIGNSHPMSVAAQIIKNLMGTAKGRLGINNPLRFATAIDESLELPCIIQFANRSVKLQLPGRVCFLEIVQEKASKQARKNPNREEESFATRNPSLSIWGETASGNHTMNMRMHKQILSPGMKHGQKADSGAQVFGVSCNATEGFRDCSKEYVVDDFFILQGNGTYAIRHGENNMEILDG
jgi:hypothetical protein